MYAIQEITKSIDGEELIRSRSGKVYILREFRVHDLASVVHINRAVLPENYPEFFFMEHHVNFPKAFIVAELDGKVVGYIMSRVEFGWSNFKKMVPVKKGHIISIGVLPEVRRIGIGYNLLLRALRSLKHHYDASEVYLEVRVSNMPAINLYKKLNFQIINVIRGYYHDGEDAYLMARILDDL